MAVNLPKIADTPYLSLYCNSTKQNDNVTMTFPVNSSLQCFRTSALSMVTLNMESRSPMGRVNAENHSKTWKSSGVNGLRIVHKSQRPYTQTDHLAIKKFSIWILYIMNLYKKLWMICFSGSFLSKWDNKGV